MNQVNNLIQWKNHTKEQKAEHDFENYSYEFQGYNEWFPLIKKEPSEDIVYRLVIEPEKWYYAHGEIKLGKYWGLDEIEEACECYPVKPDETPKPVTLEDEIKAKCSNYEVEMLGFCKVNGWLGLGEEDGEIEPHIYAQSMKGFQGYVFKRLNDESLFIDCRAVYPWNELNLLQPVAVLFEKGE